MTNTADQPQHLLIDDFFIDAPLPHPLDNLLTEATARLVAVDLWAGHVIVEVNGHCVWKPRAELQPSDMRCFYDGDIRDVLAPDDPRILIPRSECTDMPLLPQCLVWDD